MKPLFGMEHWLTRKFQRYYLRLCPSRHRMQQWLIGSEYGQCRRILYQGGTTERVGNLFRNVHDLSLMCNSQERWLTPGFDIAFCCGRRKVKDLIRCWISMKRIRERILSWRRRGHAGCSTTLSPSYLQTSRCSVPITWTQVGMHQCWVPRKYYNELETIIYKESNLWSVEYILIKTCSALKPYANSFLSI